jgi:hypothetical protein
MATETKIQQIVHKLEEGGWVRRVKITIILAAVAFVISLWFFRDAGFRGLAHEKAIEQAQIAREIKDGHGFTTKMVRPAAVWLFEKRKGQFPQKNTPDIYHAPLNPYINALVFKITDAINDGLETAGKKATVISWVTYDKHMSQKVLIYAYDKIIAAVQVAFFLLAVLVNYFIARRLFDERLAALAACMMLLCEKFWDFAMSGLPQMLMLLLFSLAAYTLLRAVEARIQAKPALPWLATTSAIFGLLALTHGITIWMFAGALLFAVFFFRPMGRDAAIMAGIFLVIYLPWMWRNYAVCGSPTGLAWYSGLVEVRGSESSIMRSLDVSLSGLQPSVFRSKVQGQVLFQLRNLIDFLGLSLMAPAFFVGLMHIFKRPDTSSFRWAILSMWAFAVFGMAVFGMPESSGVHANDLHVLFIPLMLCYGLAFILVMWTRLEINIKLVRLGFLTMLFVSSSLPFIQNLLDMVSGPQLKVQWPPYVPPYIAILNQWTKENEVITSDMPWAVAWYAERKSVWLPMTINDYVFLNDYKRLDGEIVGLYLTPITGNQGFFNGIIKGEWKEWAPFITRNVTTRDFPLKAFTPLPLDNECIFYADRDRWTNKED